MSTLHVLIWSLPRGAHIAQVTFSFAGGRCPLLWATCLKVSLLVWVWVASAASASPYSCLRAPLHTAPPFRRVFCWSVRRPPQRPWNHESSCQPMLSFQHHWVPPIFERIFCWQVVSTLPLPCVCSFVPWNAPPFFWPSGGRHRAPIAVKKGMSSSQLFFRFECIWVIPVTPVTISEWYLIRRAQWGNNFYSASRHWSEHLCKLPFSVSPLLAQLCYSISGGDRFNLRLGRGLHAHKSSNLWCSFE